MNIRVSNGFIQNFGNKYIKPFSNNKNSSIGNENIAKALNVSQEYMATFSDSLDDYSNSREYSDIISKYETGLELTDQELEILKEKCPDTYRKAIMAKMERESYKKELEKCNSKEEAKELKLKYGGKYISNMNNLTGNLDAKGEKLRIVILERTTSNVHYKYMQTEEYESLPEIIEEDKKENTSNNKIDGQTLEDKEEIKDKDELIEQAINIINIKMATIEDEGLQSNS